MIFSNSRRIITTLMAASLAVAVYSQDATKETAVRSLLENSQLEQLEQTEKEFKVLADQAEKRVQDYVVANNLSDSLARKLYDVLPDGTPLYVQFDNVNSAFTTRTDAIQPEGHTGFNLTGEDELIGMWDEGQVLESHELFTGRVSTGDWSYRKSDHSTHVAGTLVGNAYSNGGIAKGMAPQATLITYDSRGDLWESASAAREKNLLISNHSYGWWVNAVSESDLGKYNGTSSSIDRIHVNAPYYLQVWSAGNGRRIADIIYPDRGGYDILTYQKTAKNNVVVAAVHGVTSHDGPESIKMPDFSSWGPTDDGRVKPDISAKGVFVTSSGIKSNTDYYMNSGTSMASPNVAGSLLLLQEYSRKNFSTYLRSATIRGLALHNADEAGAAAGPDYSFGWGLLNMEKAANALKNIGTSSVVDEKVLDDGEVYTFKVRKTSGNEPLKVSICWTDPMGVANKNGNNDRTPALVNDLDLRVSDDNGTYYPWKLNPAVPAAAATKGDNLVDNIEIIEVDAGVEGQLYTIQVSHKGMLKDSAVSVTPGTQNYSLIVTGGKRVGGLCNLAQWDANTAYVTGEEVEYNNEFYRARHWTKNEIPSNVNLYGPWEFVKNCNDGAADAPVVSLSSSAVNGEVNGLLPITFDASVVSEITLKNVAMRVKSFGKTEYFTPTKDDTYGLTFTPTNYGMHSFEFIAVDQFGRKGSQQVNVFVYEATATPSVSITSHVNNDVVFPEVPFTIDVNAVATIGRDRDVYLTFPAALNIDRVKLDADNAPAFAYELTLPAGTPKMDIPVLAEVVESDGTVSAGQTVTLKSGITEKPAVQVISFTDTLFDTLESAVIKATATDADGSVSKVYIQHLDLSGNVVTKEMAKVGDTYEAPYTPLYRNNVFKVRVFSEDNVGASSDKQEVLARVTSADANSAPAVQILTPEPNLVRHGGLNEWMYIRFEAKNAAEDGPEYIVRSEVYLNGTKVKVIDYNKAMESGIHGEIIRGFQAGVNTIEVKTLDERGLWGTASTSFQFIVND